MDERKIPLLLEYLFGEAAGTARRTASDRLLLWSEAFDAWLADLRNDHHSETCAQAASAWKGLLRGRRMLPWELEQQDIEDHVATLQAQGCAPGTINNFLVHLSGFFRWCGERQVDPLLPLAFNPAAGARRPPVRPFARTKLLSRAELRLLLDFMRRDATPLGKRDYAFILARLNFGVPQKFLQRLQWGQLERDASVADEEGAWVRWEPGAGACSGVRACSPLPSGEGPGVRVTVPPEVWQAIRGWLAASGRLDRMQPESYVFVPLASSGRDQTGGSAEAWVERHCISKDELRHSLKLYGRRLRIAPDRLTLNALHCTSIRLRLDSGQSLEQLRAFLGSREPPFKTKYRLKHLPPIPEDAPPSAERVVAGELIPPLLPLRRPCPYQAGEGITHGFFARRQPPEDVLAMLSEDIRGIDDEFAGLREIGRGLFRMQAQSCSSQEMARLADAYTQAAARLAGLIEAVRQPGKDDQLRLRAEELLARFDELAAQQGEPPVSAAVWADIKARGSSFSRGEGRWVGGDGLAEEVAAARCVLRRTLALAWEAEEKGQLQHYIRLADIYGMGCCRLAKLLRMGNVGQHPLVAYLDEAIYDAFKIVSKELGL